MDREYGAAIPFELFALCLAIHDASRTALWMVRHWYCSYAEAGAAVAVFGLAMFLPGAFNSYLIDTFKRKSVCLVAMLLFVASSCCIHTLRL